MTLAARLRLLRLVAEGLAAFVRALGASRLAGVLLLEAGRLAAELRLARESWLVAEGRFAREARLVAEAGPFGARLIFGGITFEPLRLVRKFRRALVRPFATLAFEAVAAAGV